MFVLKPSLAHISARRWFFICFLACAVLRAPAFLYTVISDDEAIYDTMAQEVLAGGVMYRDTVDHKPPGLVYTYSVAEYLVGNGPGRMHGVHVVGLLAVLATCLGLYLTGRRLLGSTTAPMAALLYAVASAAKVPYDGLAVNGELLMNVPVVFAAVAVVEATRRSNVLQRCALDLLGGILVAIAVLYKYQAGLLLVAFGALPFVAQRFRKQGLRRVMIVGLGRAIVWLTGFVGTLGLCALYFHTRGALAEAVSWGLGFNRHYLGDAPPLLWALERFGRQVLGVVLPSIVLYVAGSITLIRLTLHLFSTRTRSSDDILVSADDRARQTSALTATSSSTDLVFYGPFVVVWSAVSIAAVGLGGRFFGHYFLQAELPLALLAAGPAVRLWQRYPRVFVMGVGLPALLFALGASFPLKDPGRWLDSDNPDYRTIGAAVAARTAPYETVWVWGNVPQIYSVSQRRPGVRFTFCNYLTGLSPATPSEYDPSVDPRSRAVDSAWDLVVADLDRRRPSLILDTAAAGLKAYAKFPISQYPKLQGYLQRHYRHEGEAGGVPVLRRVD